MSPRAITVLVAAVALGLAALVFREVWRSDAAPDLPAPTSIIAALGSGDAAGFARVTGPRPLEFPKDHGPHPDHRIEWWYFTGNLGDAAGRRYGFQLTFFRNGIAPRPVDRESRLATTQLYMAHLAVTDAEGRRFFARDRFARAALGLAGAQAQPFRVWTESWSAASEGEALLPLRLVAEEEGTGIDLHLAPGRPLVLQGDRGYSRKGSEAGNASFYTSFTRLPVRGAVLLDGIRHPVEGLAWMDHEWSTSVLDEDLAGWDWFSLQLDDGRDLMLYGMRRKDGTAGRFSYGLIVGADGGITRLDADGFAIRVEERWTSPHTGATYPARWTLEVPSEGLSLGVVPLLADQELRVAVAYWEGAVRVEDDAGLRGRGYVELVGYVEQERSAAR